MPKECPFCSSNLIAYEQITEMRFVGETKWNHTDSAYVFRCLNHHEFLYFFAPKIGLEETKIQVAQFLRLEKEFHNLTSKALLDLVSLAEKEGRIFLK